jgi:hypothetical protein
MPGVESGELLRVASLCRAVLEPFAADADWSVPAGELEWSCRTTLAHLLSALQYYSVNLATQSKDERSGGQTNESLPIDVLLDALEGRAAVLASVCSDAPPGARGGHSYGRSDVAGFVAMGCDELIVHTDDIAAGLGAAFTPPADVCGAVLARLFPWAPHDTEPWATLRWANGRAALGERARLDPEWVWHSGPVEEWDGTDPNAV